MSAQMDFYIDTLWSIDNIDSFYFRTHPKVMDDPVRVMAAIDDGLGFLAHLDQDWDKALDPYAFALAAKQRGMAMPLLSFAQLTERLQQIGVLQDDLRLRADLRPVVDRYRTGFLALERQEGIDEPMRTLGQRAAPGAEEEHSLVLEAMCNSHKAQYALAKLYFDRDRPESEVISFSETDGQYWLYRARDNGNVYAARRIERRKRPLSEKIVL